MYYYSSKFDVDVEDLILDFRARQKNINTAAGDLRGFKSAAQERNFMNKISCPLTKKFLPYVKSSVNKMNYAHSPAFEQEIDKETLAQTVEKTIAAAAKDIEEVEEISLDTDGGGISRRAMLYSLMEALVLTELFFERSAG